MQSTRAAVGEALAALGDTRPEIVVLDGEVSDSARIESFALAHPERFFECYVAEQQMLATAVGMQVRGWVPFAATLAAFFARAYDFIRMAAVSRASIRLVGSHSGASCGADGPSQMGLEDVAAMRAVHGSTVLCPCDANQAAWLTGVMADLRGVSYLRTSRGDTPVIYQPGERFEAGGSRVLRSAPGCGRLYGRTVLVSLAAADLPRTTHPGKSRLPRSACRRGYAARCGRRRGDRHGRGPRAGGRPGTRCSALAAAASRCRQSGSCRCCPCPARLPRTSNCR
jgi:transketolase